MYIHGCKYGCCLLLDLEVDNELGACVVDIFKYVIVHAVFVDVL